MATLSRISVRDLKAARIWRTFDQLVASYTVRYADAAEVVLTAEGRAAADAYGRTGSSAAALAEVRPAAWAKYLDRVWLTVVPAAGEWAEATLLKAAQDIFLDAAVKWLRENGAEHVTNISDYGRRTIANQIRIGVQKGETQAEIAARISYHYASIKPSRARRIARTEVHAAANLGSLTAAQEVRRKLDKVWLATPDDRVRDAHYAAHGQRVALDEPFEVMGEQLQFPGDTSMGASGANVINCRCTLGYEAARRR